MRTGRVWRANGENGRVALCTQVAFKGMTGPVHTCCTIGSPVNFSRFLPMLRPAVTYSPRTGRWTLVSDYRAVVGSHILEIPAGFTFDLASVPRPFWFLITPYHLSIPAPLIHDWLYRSRGCFRCRGGRRVCFRRSEADRHFFRLMRTEGVHMLVAFAAWLVVRAVGWLWWRPFEEDSRVTENLAPENRLATDTSSGQGEIPDRRYGA